MPSSPDPIGGNELQAAGENLGTWGAPKLNQVITNLAFMIAGRTTYACNGSYTPTTTNYVANEFRAFIHDVTGTGGAVTMPARSFVKLFRNQCAASITVGNGGAVATVLAGKIAIVWSDGTDCYRLWDNDAGGARLQNLADPVSDTDGVNKRTLIATAFATQSGDFPGLEGNRGRPLIVADNELGPTWSAEYVEMTADFDAIPGGKYLVNTASGAITATLWDAPSEGDVAWFADGGYALTLLGWGLNNFTIDRNGEQIMSLSEDLVCAVRGASFGLAYTNSGYRIIT